MPRPAARGLLVTTVVAAAGGGLPGDGTAQDTASAAKRAWIGIRFHEETRAAPGPGEGTYALVVRDVYGNGPADRVGIRPGDWFIAVDGNPLSAYEAWLRSTSDLGLGKTLTVRLVRDSHEQEVVVVAGRRPGSIPPHPLSRPEMEMVQARFDSLFDLFLGAGPRAEQWPGFSPPHISVPRGFGFGSAPLRVTMSDSGLTAEGSVLAAPGDETRVFRPAQRLPDTGDRGEVRLKRRTVAGAGREAGAGRARIRSEQGRGEEREPGRRAALEDSRTRSGASEAYPPDSRGGDGDPHRIYGTSSTALTVPTRQLLASTVTVVLGGAVVRDLAAELGRYFGVGAGVLVTDVVDATTPAAQAGFRPGDIIVSVEDRQVEDLVAFRRVLAEEDPPIEITVVRRGKTLKLAYPSR